GPQALLAELAVDDDVLERGLQRLDLRACQHGGDGISEQAAGAVVGPLTAARALLVTLRLPPGLGGQGELAAVLAAESDPGVTGGLGLGELAAAVEVLIRGHPVSLLAVAA